MFKKFLVTYISITVISLFIATFLISYFYESFIFEEKKDYMLRQATIIEEMYYELIDNKITQKDFFRSLNILRRENIDVTMIGIEGVIFPRSAHFGRIPVNYNLIKELFTKEDNNPLFYYQEHENIKFLTVGFPLIVEETTIGAIVLFAPVRDIKSTVDEINRLIYIVFILISLPTALVLFFFSRRFSQPLEKMSEIAAKIAAGDFSQSLKVKGKDEIAELSLSINNMVKQLQELEDLRKDLIANVSHELKTPLTTIRNFVQGILDGVITEDKASEYLQIVIAETKRLGTLVNDLIDLAALEKGKVNLSLKKTDITIILKELATQLEYEFSEKKISLRLDLEDEMIVAIDVERFKQVLLNILNNALAFSKEGDEIKLKAFTFKQMVIIKVIDNGCGIASADLKYVFERFYKGDKSRQKGKTTSGLGLTISKHLVEAHGGQITIDSMLNQGTTVTIKLPI